MKPAYTLGPLFCRDTFAALVQTANSPEAAAVVSGLSSKMSAHEQAYRVGQAWEALPEPKRQITFYVVSPMARRSRSTLAPMRPPCGRMTRSWSTGFG